MGVNLFQYKTHSGVTEFYFQYLFCLVGNGYALSSSQPN